MPFKPPKPSRWPTLCLLLFFGVPPLLGQATSSVLLVHSRLDDPSTGRVWSVDPAGAARVVLEFSPAAVGRGGLTDSVLNSTVPHPAPNGDMIAYIEADDLWILDLAAGQSRRWTDVNANCREGDLIAQANLTAWSPDGSQLLFGIGKPAGPDPFSEYERCPAAYGFYRFDIHTQAIEPVRFLNAEDRDPNLQYRAFFGNEHFLVSRRQETAGPPPNMLDNILDILVVDGDASRVVATFQGSIEWVDLSADSRYAAYWSLEAGPDAADQILKLDFGTGKAEAVSSNADRLLGRSKLSPSGRRTAYERHVFIDVEPAEQDFLIDDQVVLAGVPLDFEWFDDDRIAVLLREVTDDGVVDSIVIVDAATGEAVSRMEVSRY